MKTKIITTEDEQWLVLTPENAFEKKVIQMFEGMPNVFLSQFAESRGGYLRQYENPKDLIIKFPNSHEEKGN